MSAKKSLKERFFAKICYNPSVIRTYTPKGGGPSTTVIRGCFEWTWSTTGCGYGAIREGSKMLYAHRVRYGLETGLEIPKGLCICHRCDNPRCVTFAHLFIGTQGDNTRDKVKKGRQSKGEKHSAANVPDKEKERIVEAYATGAFTQRELAEQAGVAKQTVSSWVNGERRRTT